MQASHPTQPIKPDVPPSTFGIGFAFIVVLAMAFAISNPTLAIAQLPPKLVDFQREVVPLLSKRCLHCHSGADPKGQLDMSNPVDLRAGGASGQVIEPGKSADSLLVQYVLEDKMPPKQVLSDSDKDLLQRWVDQGARWEGIDNLDPMLFSSDQRAGADWWSLQPIAAPVIPDVRDSQWSQTPIDRFVFSRLAAEKLSPSPVAERRLLARRLWFDLLGLPPSPEDVAKFEADKRPDAYERLVDRLLATPAHGEHWARHWLDIAHFGESDGFEYDRLRPNAWPYRDWVIRALNDDLPYDEFARRQIAGDLLVGDNRAEARSLVAATGFIVGGAHDGLKPQVESMRLLMRQDELEDLTALVGQTFLGLTVQCARCHDHKFDPLRQEDYYRFAATLGGVHRGNRSVADVKIVQSLEAKLQELISELKSIEQPARIAALGARTSERQPSPVPSAYQWDFQQPLANADSAISLKGGATLENEGLVLDGNTGYAASEPLTVAHTEKTLEAWLSLASLQQRGGAVLSLQSNDGVQFDAIVFGEREPRHWMAGSNNFSRTQNVGGAPEELEAKLIHVAITYSQDGTITVYRNGTQYGSSYKTTLAKFEAGKAQLLFGLRHGAPGPGKLLKCTIHRARLHVRCLSLEEVRESYQHAGNFLTDEEVARQLTGPQLDRRARLQSRIAALRDELRREREQQAFSITPQPAPVARILLRGNPLTPGHEVRPGSLAVLESIAAKFELAQDADDATRRLGLANWIASQQNPLFSRTIANRLWQYHFGQGLVQTPNDLGFNGGKPSHPELLDWMAGSLSDAGFNLKLLHRKIVNSSTYRQNSLPNEQALRVDAANQLLWRHAPTRLSSEMLRDAMLSVAGELNSVGGGQGFQDFRPFLRGGTQFYERIDPISADSHRRTVYRTWARGGTNPLLDVFDCPDPSTLTPKRSATNTPLQSLALLNNSFSMRMTERLSERLQREFVSDPLKSLKRGYELVYCRQPDTSEIDMSQAFIARHGLAAWCRVLLNSNEFLYVR